MNVVLVGAGGLAREVLHWFLGQVSFKGFKDKPRQPDERLHGLPVSENMKGDRYVVVIANDLHRKQRVTQSLGDLPFTSLVHRFGLCFSPLGVGSVVAPFTKVGPDTDLGDHCFYNVGCTVGHNSKVGDYTFIGPNANLAGYSQVGKGVYFGSNSTLINRVSVGDWSIIGSGAVVNKDIPPYSVAVGVPAKVIKKIGESDDCDERVQRV